MLEKVTVLSAARAYEYRRDDLRLTALSTAPVQAILGEAFNFDTGGIDSPPPVFGPEPRTNPRGLVFNLGSWTSPEGTVTPVRSLTFSRQRIVLSIAGPSDSIDPVHEYLVGLLENVDLLGGSPIAGKPHNIRDRSEISARFAFDLADLLAPTARSVLQNTLVGDEGESILLPALNIEVQPRTKEYVGPGRGPSGTLNLAIRAGGCPADREYYSAAFLDSDAHLAYLQQLDGVLSDTTTPSSAKKSRHR